MFIILNSWIEVISAEDQIFLKNLLNEEIIAISMKKIIDTTLLIKMLTAGLHIKDKSDIDSEEKQAVILIMKNHRKYFWVGEEQSNLRKINNLRGIIHLCTATGTDKTILSNYISVLDNEDIFYIGEHFEEVASFMSAEGLTRIKRINPSEVDKISEERKQSIILLEKTSADNVHFLKGIIYVLFSLEKLQIGPILLKGKTSCLTCALSASSKAIDNKFKAAWYDKFIFTFLVGIVYYLIGNLYEEVYHDVALPLNKFYSIKVPQCSVHATSLYKNIDCGGCLNDEEIG